jgi:hypothetical protein
VAIEQFIIDLAGYYRSLLLLKNGITRESLLGYSPQRFSAMVLERLDSIRLEQALSLLLTCYRDIRYSVSPRFELEAAVSKLAWLTRWVSPPELSAALAAARSVLGSGASRQADGGPRGTPRPSGGAGSGAGLSAANPGPGFGGGPGGESPVPAGDTSGGASPVPEQPLPPEPQKIPGSGVADSPMQFSGTGSLSEDFKRLLAAKKNRPPDGPVPAYAGGGEQDDADDDVPVWSRFTGTPEPAEPGAANLPEPGNQGAFTPGGPEPDIAPQAQRVLRVFPGTIIKTGGGEQ